MIDYQKVINFAPFVVIEWKNSIGWPVLWVSENINNLTGYSTDDFMSSNVNFYELVEPDYLVKFDEQIKQANERLKEKLQLETFPIKTRNGSLVWVELFLVIQRNNLGNITSYTGYILDVSQRVEAQQQLLDSQSENQALINAIPDTILQISRSGILKKYKSYSSLRKEEYEDNKIEIFINEIFPADFAKNVPAHVESVVTNDVPEVFEYVMEHYNGDNKYYEARFSRINDQDALIIIRDISERKSHEIMMQEAMEKVENATIEKNRFLSNMSHELRTPLNAILGFGQLLSTDGVSDKDLADEILYAGEHLLALINDILDISKIEAGKVDLNIRSIPVSNIVDDCKILIKPISEKYGIKVIVEDLEQDINVLADRTRLTQIVINLLTNAVKYNSDNGTVVLGYEPHGKNQFRIKVTDTGIGLSEEKIAKLFNPFERVGAEKSNVEGTGLGLALSKKLVELMDGEIGVDSMPGKGSSFWIALNISTENESSDLTENETSSQKIDINKEIEKLNIVYVEDNEQNQRLIKAIVDTKTPHNITMSDTGESGISQIKELKPDLVLLDLQLPDMSGYQVLDMIRQDPSICNIPVVAVTANATEHDMKKIENANFYQYIIKPIKVENLLTLLGSIGEIKSASALKQG